MLLANRQQFVRRPLQILTSCSAFLHTSASLKWRNYENERHYEQGEDMFGRTWHGLTYDYRRAKRRFQEVCVSGCALICPVRLVAMPGNAAIRLPT